MGMVSRRFDVVPIALSPAVGAEIRKARPWNKRKKPFNVENAEGFLIHLL